MPEKVSAPPPKLGLFRPKAKNNTETRSLCYSHNNQIWIYIFTVPEVILLVVLCGDGQENRNCTRSSFLYWYVRVPVSFGIWFRDLVLI